MCWGEEGVEADLDMRRRGLEFSVSENALY